MLISILVCAFLTLCKVAFDIIGQLTLSRRLGFLESAHDVDGMLNELNIEFDYRGTVQNMPWLDRVLRKNPLYLYFKTPTSFFAAHSRRLAAERMQDEKHEGVDMLDGFLDARKKHPDIVDEVTMFGLISTNFLAGSDTTSVSLRSIIYNLLKNPNALKKLQGELDANVTVYPPDYTTAANLKYLDAVIHEALRVHPIGSIVFERVVPSLGHTTSVSGTELPPGTQIAQTPWTMNFDEQIWGPEPRKFKPERWLRYENESEEEFEKRHALMKHNDFSFSYGPRACLGRHIAWMEMVTVVPTLFGLLDVSGLPLVVSDHDANSYQIQLADPQKEWEVHGAFFTRQHDMDVTMKWRDGVDEARILD